LSDDEDDNESAADILKKGGSIQQLLMRIPPDFDLAEKNGVRITILIC
jgi:hypothetical protein